jgi:hypothetical protein
MRDGEDHDLVLEDLVDDGIREAIEREIADFAGRDGRFDPRITAGCFRDLIHTAQQRFLEESAKSGTPRFIIDRAASSASTVARGW